MTPTKRAYRSPIRDELAEQTRSRIVDAAVTEFLEHGYVGATVANIARRAEVSRPTVFAVGSKAHLLRLARDRAIADDGVVQLVATRPTFSRIAETTDAAGVLRAYARISAPILRRFAPFGAVVRQAAAIDADARSLWQDHEAERHRACTLIVEIVGRKGRFREGLSRAAAADILWLVNDPEHYRRLTEDRGWSHRRFERWYADAMVRLLLP